MPAGFVLNQIRKQSGAQVQLLRDEVQGTRPCVSAACRRQAAQTHSTAVFVCVVACRLEVSSRAFRCCHESSSENGAATVTGFRNSSSLLSWAQASSAALSTASSGLRNISLNWCSSAKMQRRSPMHNLLHMRAAHAGEPRRL